ncbi:hypothetical protein [Streptomyces phytophilus]|uniref:hypothetical protein n=1 Tax=Streptomyces phytophilus TaxID=722715 RepID=UPI0015F025D4|nr:hypothetical protein [Streptomyces phytophilus]
MTTKSQADQAASEVRQLPLDTARECFGWLVTGPQPLAVDGRAYAGLPNRLVPLDELRERLLHRRCPRATRDAVWAELITRSRREGATWTLACTGMALPVLATTVRWLTSRYPDDAFDIQAEVLTGFLGALATVDLERPHVLVRLRWVAYRAGIALLFEELDAPTPLPPGYRSTVPRPPWGHPDLVLARAVREGVLTRTEADLIGATRLEDVPISRWADSHRTTVPAAYQMRHRGEHRLTDYLRGSESRSDDADPVGEHVAGQLTPLAPPSGRSTSGPSRNVASRRGGRRTKQTKKVAPVVSKTGSDSGLLNCGRSTPRRPQAPTSEVPRCA